MSRPPGSDDRYLLQRILGEGGSGRVWLVEDSLRPGTRLALKELFLGDPGAPRYAETLRREFATLACLRHPNLVEVHEFDTSPESGLPRFTLEFIEGRNIVDAVSHEGPGLFLDLAAEALRALAFLHDFELIHRDLKPANLLVRERPKLGCRLVLVDFGLAQQADESLEAFQAKGTLPYMAPELFHNQPAGRRSDLYALGAVLYQAVFGRPPFASAGDDLARFIHAVTEGRRARPPLPGGYPDGLHAWLTRMLSPDPDGRPETAIEALARLNDACGTEYPPETPASRAARLLSGAPAEREADIARIWDSLDRSGGPWVIWLCGNRGSGKTRVLRWLEADAILRGWQVATGDPQPRASLGELRAMAAKQPTLLLLDELETAGGQTVELLERVARESRRPPLKIVAALRPGRIRQPGLQRLFAGTGTVPTLSRIDLDRLDRDGLRAMARRATGSQVSEERVEWLLEVSEGEPALAESLLIDGAWERGASEIPAGRREPVPVGRLEMLSGAARNWLECLAVLRRSADEAHVAELAGLKPGPGRTAAEEAAAAGLAYRRGGRWFPDSRPLAEQLLDCMEPDRRRVLHLRAAHLVEASSGDHADPWLLSQLWSEAGARDRAIECAVRAAGQSDRDGDPAEAASCYGAALRLLERGKPGRHGLRTKQADALMRAGLYQAAVRASGAAVRLSRTDEARAGALAHQAHALVQAGRFQLALDVAERAAQLASRAGASEELAQAKKAAGIVLGRLGREHAAIPLLETAREMFHRKNDTSAEAETLQVLATCKLRLGNDEAENDFLQAIELYRKAGGDEAGARGAQELKARTGLAVIKYRRGEHDEAVGLLEDVRQVAAEQGNLGLQEFALAKLAVVAIEQGRLDEAMNLAEQAADLALHLGDHNLILVNHCRLADAQIRCGRPGQALALLRETLDGELAQVEPENVDYARMLLADAWMASGNADEDHVRTLLEESIARCRKRPKHRALLMALVIEMERRARPDCSDPFHPVSIQFDAAAQSSDEPLDAEIRIRADLARASHHLSHGNPEAARTAAAEAASAAADSSAIAFHARARSILAEALSLLGDEQGAAEALKTGRELLDQAAARIRSDEVRSDFLKRPVFATLHEEKSLASRRNQSRLLALYDMIRVLNSASDPETLLESILDMALRAVPAERGMVLLKDAQAGGDRAGFSVHLARDLEAETVRDVESYSRHIVAAAGAGRSLLAVDAGKDQRFRDLDSVSLYGIRSLMCVPLRSRGKIIGTVYLDSRHQGALFTPDDLRFIEAFADHAALALENARARARLEQQNRRLQVVAETRTEFANLIGRSPGMQAVFDLIEKVAATDLPVLIRGESGTGKELVARAMHFHGPRRRRAFVSENCAALPETLLESELFGHVRGAFTGAERDRSGLFELAHRGTLFLDEVGEMSPAMQARLLRVLEDGEVRRVGGEKPIEVDVRVVAATHSDPKAEVRAGRFREDLLYRLQVLTIELPPLRERPGDVALLVSHFLRRIAGERGREPVPLDDEVLSLLERYPWPGNVRELENTLQRLVLLAGRNPITLPLVDSDPELRRTLVRESRSGEPAFSLKSGEKEQIRRALEAAGGNRRKTADLLGVSRETLYRKIRQHDI